MNDPLAPVTDAEVAELELLQAAVKNSTSYIGTVEALTDRNGLMQRLLPRLLADRARDKQRIRELEAPLQPWNCATQGHVIQWTWMGAGTNGEEITPPPGNYICGRCLGRVLVAGLG